MRKRSLRPQQRGAIAVEFALLLVPLLMIAFAITEFGRAIYQYNTLNKSVRNAARYLTTVAPGDADAQAAAKNLAVYGNPQGEGQPLLPNLDVSMVSICDRLNTSACGGEPHNVVPTGMGAINLVTVNLGGGMPYAAPYTFTFLAPYVSTSASLDFGRIHITMQQVI